MSLTPQQQAQLDYLVEWVSARVDELMPNASSPDAPVPYIQEELDKAALYILRTARKQLVYPAAKVLNSVTVNVTLDQEKGAIYIACPDDYIRFLRLQLAHWKRPVDQIISVDANRYRQQSNRFLSGDIHKPVATLIPSESGIGMAIEAMPMFNGAADEQVREFYYVPRLKCYDMPEDLVDPMVWLAASRALTILRQEGLARQAENNMQQSMNQLLVGLYGEEMPSTRQ